MNRSEIANTLILLCVLMAGTARAQDTAATEGSAPKTEKVTYLGVTAKAVDETLRAQLNLPEGVGLTVMSVDHKGPSAADVQENDVLQKLDDQLLIDAHQLVTLIRLHHAGDSVTITLIREAKPMQVTIKLGEKQRPVAPGNDADRVSESPDLGEPQDLTSPGPFDPQSPLGPNSVAMSFKDDAYSARISTDKDGHKQLTVIDALGKVVAKTVVDTPDQWQKLPPDIQTHLDMMRKMMVKQK